MFSHLKVDGGDGDCLQTLDPPERMSPIHRNSAGRVFLEVGHGVGQLDEADGHVLHVPDQRSEFRGSEFFEDAFRGLGPLLLGPVVGRVAGRFFPEPFLDRFAGRLF